MSILQWPSPNLLLAALPDEVRQRLSLHIERVQMVAGQVLCEPGVPLREAWFPESSVVAISFAMENGSCAEVSLVGREGMVGVRLFLGATSLTVRASVQSAGLGLKLPAPCLLEEFGRGGAVMQVLLRYTGSYIAQIVQTAACNRHGTLEQRLCRWLLMSLDRMPTRELTMTHELIASALGVKREGITEALGRLHRRGAIGCRRGHIEVLERSLLERWACECYEAAGQREPARAALGSGPDQSFPANAVSVR